MDINVLSDSIAQAPVVILVALNPVLCLQREIKQHINKDVLKQCRRKESTCICFRWGMYALMKSVMYSMLLSHLRAQCPIVILVALSLVFCL